MILSIPVILSTALDGALGKAVRDSAEAAT